MQANVRFLLFPSGKEFTKSFPVNTTFLVVKQTIFNEWPTHLPPVSSVEDVRLIHSGRIIEEQQTVQEVFKITENDVSITVHITLKRSVTPPAAPVESPPTEEEEDLHLHFCGIDEEEVNMIGFVFDKKKGQDNKIAFSEVDKFLKSYWTWMKRNNHKDMNDGFPSEMVSSLRTKLIGQETRVSKDQLYQFFYLFDHNMTSEHKCPHGEKLRVRFSTQQLHRTILPESDFASEVFDSVFNDVDKDADGILSCQELELLYYMYSARIMECQ